MNEELSPDLNNGITRAIFISWPQRDNIVVGCEEGTGSSSFVTLIGRSHTQQ